MEIFIFIYCAIFILINKFFFKKIKNYCQILIKKKYNYDIEFFNYSRKKQARSLISLLREYFLTF